MLPGLCSDMYLLNLFSTNNQIRNYNTSIPDQLAIIALIFPEPT
jgi:hypothetical protein